MPVSRNKELLDCLFHRRPEGELEVFTFCLQHLHAAIEEAGFDDFSGHDYEVVNRMSWVVWERDSEAALWGRVFIDLWHCENFRPWPHWVELIRRDPTNVRYAIQAAHWVFAVSSANGGRALAAIINQCRCWRIADQYIPRQYGDRLRQWWLHSVLTYRSIG
jgi:hypothetical protein